MSANAGDGATLTTHVLDTSLGKPAEGVAIRLYALGVNDRTALGRQTTNADGRTDAPLGTNLAPGSYELVFSTRGYFDRDARRALFDDIPVRFTIEADRAHYHIPLLLAPFGYSTYRGS